jgi:hypothetical protein
LVLSMSIGAALLFLMEGSSWSRPARGAARAEGEVRSVAIGYVPTGAMLDENAYDCVIDAEGVRRCAVRGPTFRVAIVSDGAARLDPAIQRDLLRVLAWLMQTHGLTRDQVRLADASDARLHPSLPADAHDLKDLLVSREFVR